MERNLKTKNPNMRELVCLLRLHGEDFKQVKFLYEHQRSLWKSLKATIISLL